jgi:hypothetical protein
MDEFPLPEMSLGKSFNEIVQEEKRHVRSLKKYFTDQGYTGKHTGKIYSAPVADGAAQYLVLHAGRSTGLKTSLLHLPYGDAWHCRDVQHLPQKVVF